MRRFEVVMRLIDRGIRCLSPFFLRLLRKRHETEKMIDDINAAWIFGFGLEFDGKKWDTETFLTLKRVKKEQSNQK